ncbi:ROK family transcriptional regulator [Celeribacter neptunius]|uniref:Sugar kinase of the NBD/HSP70 family, may contain an N-terminal HTH domain n=1 Tax=Celeribacter neptunius TaxID=588602 RepID=A0A1I3LU34_9RHOB|nr:ROK family transcriptional regulator [Celeribacter neptunius]SFI88025.1 Sugar kinase of the NBD/HSP70 family, may contain an N-terminal HTH domain [Celeribacter neptunius]
MSDTPPDADLAPPPDTAPSETLQNGCGPLFANPDSGSKSIRRQVFEAVRSQGEIARVDLSRQLNISPATVTQTASDLIAAGLIEESELQRRDTDSTRGRPPVGLKVRAGAAVVVGIKISDRSNSAVVLDLAGNLLGSATLPAPPTARSTEEILLEAEAITAAGLKDAGLEGHRPDTLALGLPGMVDFDLGRVLWCPFMESQDVPLRDLLTERLGAPVRIDNDANLLALAELWFGEGRGLDNFAVVSIEHGLGMGLVIRHQLHRGGMGHGMELGHTKVQLDGALCRCGQRGCLEAYVADYALVREAHTALNPGYEASDADEMLETLYRQAKEGNELAKTIFSRAGRYLAAGIANVVTLFDPALILLSGDRLRYDFLYAEDVLSEAHMMTHRPGRPPTPVEIHAWGDLVWARGAGALALDFATETLVG